MLYNMGMRVSLFPLGISQFPSWGNFMFPLAFKLLITVFCCSLCFFKSHQWEMHQVVQGICFLSLVYFWTILDSIVLAKILRPRAFLSSTLLPSIPPFLLPSFSSFLPFSFLPSFFLQPLFFPSFPTVSIELFSLCKRATEERFAVPFVPHCPHKKQIFSGWLEV